MKSVVFIALLLAVAYAIPSDEVLKGQFNDFMALYKKSYSPSEMDTRFQNYKASVARVEASNAAGTGATFGITKFSDMTTQEFRTTILMSNFTRTAHNAPEIGASNPLAPATFDWRQHNAVTPVKDQGQCGSCWAFSATEAIESAWILKGHATPSTVDLAPQQIVDCDTIDGVQGCNGGETESAYDYIVKAGGQDTEKSYPYTAKNGACAFKPTSVDAKITGYSSISKVEANLPATLSSVGPLSICLDAAHWQDYTSGVMTALQCCPPVGMCQMDHCVQLVGYDSTPATPYWIVRNSWNTDWGIAGYIYLEMNHNTCGMANDVTWPTSA